MRSWIYILVIGLTMSACTDSKQPGVTISVLEDVALIHLEGRGLLGKVGVDARIFGALEKRNINVGIISQGSSERGIGLVVGLDRAEEAQHALRDEFQLKIKSAVKIFNH